MTKPSEIALSAAYAKAAELGTEITPKIAADLDNFGRALDLGLIPPAELGRLARIGYTDPAALDAALISLAVDLALAEGRQL